MEKEPVYIRHSDFYPISEGVISEVGNAFFKGMTPESVDEYRKRLPKNSLVYFFIGEVIGKMVNLNDRSTANGYKCGSLFCYELLKTQAESRNKNLPLLHLVDASIYLFDISGIADEHQQRYLFEDGSDIRKRYEEWLDLLNSCHNGRGLIFKKIEKEEPALLRFFKELDASSLGVDPKFIEGIKYGILDIYHLFKSHSQRMGLEQVLNLPSYGEQDEAPC